MARPLHSLFFPDYEPVAAAFAAFLEAEASLDARPEGAQRARRPVEPRPDHPLVGLEAASAGARELSAIEIG
jgi:hypothetical protein